MDCLSPARPRGPQAVSLLGVGPPNLSLSRRKGYSWESKSPLPIKFQNEDHSSLNDPVTVRNIQMYVETFVLDVKSRASGYRTPHILWPWVSSSQALVSASQPLRAHVPLKPGRSPPRRRAGLPSAHPGPHPHQLLPHPELTQPLPGSTALARARLRLPPALSNFFICDGLSCFLLVPFLLVCSFFW